MVLNTNFFHSFANARHRLEIVRLFPSLDLIELVAHIMPGVPGKVPYGFQRIAEEAHGSHTSDYIQLNIEQSTLPSRLFGQVISLQHPDAESGISGERDSKPDIVKSEEKERLPRRAGGSKLKE